MLIGKRTKQPRRTVPTSTTTGCSSRPTEVQVGDMCLLDCPKYEDNWPQVGVAMNIDNETVTIKWYKGGIAAKQKPEVLIQKGKGKIDWVEEVTKDNIWHFGFKLTPSGYLPQDIKLKIQEYNRD